MLIMAAMMMLMRSISEGIVNLKLNRRNVFQKNIDVQMPFKFKSQVISIIKYQPSNYLDYRSSKKKKQLTGTGIY